MHNRPKENPLHKKACSGSMPHGVRLRILGGGSDCAGREGATTKDLSRNWHNRIKAQDGMA